MSEGLTFYKPTTKYLVLACLGSLLVGVLMPCSLMLLHTRGLTPRTDVLMPRPAPIGPGPLRNIPAAAPADSRQLFKNCVGTVALGLILCGPGAVILAAVAFGLLHKHRHAHYERQIQHGILMGAGFSFFNLPGYLAALFLDWGSGKELVSVLRLILLFSVTGATCGIWIAWQVWRSDHDGERFLPRYTLKTLMLLVFGWALLLALFKPM